MKYLLLGNGFDIHHKLPTKYGNVIKVFDFWMNSTYKYIYLSDLINAYIEDNPDDQEISNYYLTYREQINKTIIDHRRSVNILENLQKNIWFRYVLKSMKSSGENWVDFEHTISEVLSLLRNIYKNNLKLNQYIHKDAVPINIGYYNQQNLLDAFDEFFVLHEEGCAGCRFDYLKRNFIDDYSHIDLEKMFSKLYEQLQELKKAFCFYFDVFVNNVVSDKYQSISILDLPPIDFVINLNYTDTYEKIYIPDEQTTAIIHYHGDANKGDIVLGINSDQDDEYSEKSSYPDATCLLFKKYYQRVFYQCDVNYLTIVRNFLRSSQTDEKDQDNNELIIIGHSLDITDKDVLLELFTACKRIYIYYHNNKAFGEYIKKLIILLGKKEFEQLRKDGRLHFYELHTYGLDYTTLKSLRRAKIKNK